MTDLLKRFSLSALKADIVELAYQQLVLDVEGKLITSVQGSMVSDEIVFISNSVSDEAGSISHVFRCEVYRIPPGQEKIVAVDSDSCQGIFMVEDHTAKDDDLFLILEQNAWGWERLTDERRNLVVRLEDLVNGFNGRNAIILGNSKFVVMKNMFNYRGEMKNISSLP